MEEKDFTNLDSVTIADFKEAIFNAHEEMNNCLKKGNLKGYWKALKLKIQLNNLLDQKMVLVRKQNSETGKQL